MAKSFVTMVFCIWHVFWAIVGTKGVAKIYTTTLLNLINVSYKHRCILECRLSVIHVWKGVVEKFVTRFHVTNMIFLRFLRHLTGKYCHLDHADSHEHQPDHYEWHSYYPNLPDRWKCELNSKKIQWKLHETLILLSVLSSFILYF